MLYPFFLNSCDAIIKTEWLTVNKVFYNCYALSYLFRQMDDWSQKLLGSIVAHVTEQISDPCTQWAITSCIWDIKSDLKKVEIQSDLGSSSSYVYMELCSIFDKYTCLYIFISVIYRIWIATHGTSLCNWMARWGIQCIVGCPSRCRNKG